MLYMENLLPASTTAQLVGTVSQLLSDFKEVIFVVCGILLAMFIIEIFFPEGAHDEIDTVPDEDTL